MQPATPVGGGLHVPNVPPLAMLQMPVQHSAAFAHTSPSCVQNEGWLHVPFGQNPEQHSPLSVHALPSVLHSVLSGTHAPPEQVPLQQAAFELHGCLSEVHGEVQTHP